MLLFTVFGYPLQNQILQSYGVLCSSDPHWAATAWIAVAFQNKWSWATTWSTTSQYNHVSYNEIQQTTQKCIIREKWTIRESAFMTKNVHEIKPTFNCKNSRNPSLIDEKQPWGVSVVCIWQEKLARHRLATIEVKKQILLVLVLKEN